MRALIAVLLAAALALPVAAQVSPPLRLTWWADVGFPTPFAFSALGPGGVARLSLIYDTLVWKDARGLIPWLADAWRLSADGTTYTFMLHASPRWHDGRPLTARDVKFSFDYYRRHPFRWVDASMIATVDVVDRRTVRIRLTAPYAPFLANVAGIVPIIPEHIWRGVERPEREQSLGMAVGSGPYKVVDYRPEAGAYRFLAFDAYFKGRPRIEEIQYTVTPIERQVLAIQSGQTDIAMATTYDVARAFAGHPYLRVLETEPLSVARLVFHLDRTPTALRSFRQAMAHALDLKRIAETITRGPAPVGNPGVIPPTDPWYVGQVMQYPYDPARARALLRASGYRDRDGWLEGGDRERLQVELLSAPAPDAELIAQMLREAGIDARVRIVDPATRAQLAGEGRFQILFSTHTGAGGDPDYLRTWFTGTDANEFAQGSRMRSPEYLRLARLQAQTVDQAARARYVGQMQVMLSRDLPTLPLYYRRFFWVYDSRRFTPISTRGGLMNGLPLADNKLAFLTR